MISIAEVEDFCRRIHNNSFDVWLLSDDIKTKLDSNFTFTKENVPSVDGIPFYAGIGFNLRLFDPDDNISSSLFLNKQMLGFNIFQDKKLEPLRKISKKEENNSEALLFPLQISDTINIVFHKNGSNHFFIIKDVFSKDINISNKNVHNTDTLEISFNINNILPNVILN